MPRRYPRRGAGVQDVRQAGLGVTEATQSYQEERMIPIPGQLFGTADLGAVTVSVCYRLKGLNQPSEMGFSIGG